MEKEKRKNRDPRKVLKQGNKFNFSSYIILKLNSISANFIKKLMIKIFLFLIRESESSDPEGAKKKGAKKKQKKNWKKGNFDLFISCNKFNF